MGPIGPPTSPKHADRPRLLASRVFYSGGCCYSGRSLLYTGQGIQGSQVSLCGPHSGPPHILFFEGYIRTLTYSILAHVNKNRIRYKYNTVV